MWAAGCTGVLERSAAQRGGGGGGEANEEEEEEEEEERERDVPGESERPAMSMAGAATRS